VDFRNTVIILTSNLGGEILARQPEAVHIGYASSPEKESWDATREEVMEVVRRAFRPEFLNRLDEILLFHRLTREQMTGIVDIQLGRLRQRLAERKIHLDLTEAAQVHFANAGYDPVYGARPLKRLLQKEIETTLGRKILAGEVPDGSHVVIDYDGHALVITSTPA
jgi:ATP-dependent Clp protease ATP-binding subunit ClpB